MYGASERGRVDAVREEWELLWRGGLGVVEVGGIKRVG